LQLDFNISPKGFNNLDFDEIKRVGALVGFDIRACVCKKKSCGPGPDWWSQDKRYFTLMLLKHIDGFLQNPSAALPADVLEWREKAQAAAQEYARMEQRLYPLPTRPKKTNSDKP
jgi:hypothetical protein